MVSTIRGYIIPLNFARSYKWAALTVCIYASGEYYRVATVSRKNSHEWSCIIIEIYDRIIDYKYNDRIVLQNDVIV